MDEISDNLTSYALKIEQEWDNIDYQLDELWDVLKNRAGALSSGAPEGLIGAFDYTIDFKKGELKRTAWDLNYYEEKLAFYHVLSKPVKNKYSVKGNFSFTKYPGLSVDESKHVDFCLDELQKRIDKRNKLNLEDFFGEYFYEREVVNSKEIKDWEQRVRPYAHFVRFPDRSKRKD